MEKQVESESRETVYDGYFKIYKNKLRHTLFAGGWSESIDRELFDRGQVACVLAYDPALDAVLLVEQFRIGAIDDPDTPWLMEIVAGVVEAGEEPDEVVQREALEEAGCTLGEVEQIAEFYVSPGCSSEVATVFFSECSLKDVGGLHGLAEEGEDIEARVVPRTEAMRMLTTGEIRNSKALVALQWLALNYSSRYEN
ncbi:MAG: NUDIX domain-containing protein [Pseudomonadota bacterium]